MDGTKTLPDQFRGALRKLATTITIITAGEGESRTGMAATAVMPATTEPPTLLIAVNKSASIHSVIVHSGSFCVNLLRQNHGNLVGIFSGGKKGLERFADGSWRHSARGVPVLSDALATVHCNVDRSYEIGTHTIFVGAVDQIDQNPTIDPLLWVDGSAASLQEPVGS